MSTATFTRLTVRFLDWLALHTLPPDHRPKHQQTGQRGEEDAYFYLRKQGYIIVARNFRSPRRRGEIDIVAWEKDVLCFVEVKTRTTRDVKPAEAAVDRGKRKELSDMAGEYLRHISHFGPWRFDIVTVYYDQPGKPRFEIFKNILALS